MELENQEQKEGVDLLVEKGLLNEGNNYIKMIDILSKDDYKKDEVAEILESFKETFIARIEHYDKMMVHVGLATAFDLIMLDVAKAESRARIQTLNPAYSLHLLFQMENEDNLRNNPKVAPNAVFVEQKRNLIKTTEGEIVDVQGEDFYGLWLLKKGKLFDEPVLSFPEFHAYAHANIKGNKSLSLEKLYATIEKRRGEIYFLTNGSREDFSNMEKIIVIFITPFNLIVYEIPTIKWEEQHECLVSQWIHPSAKIYASEITETAIYELPPYALVDVKEVEEADRREKEKQKVTFATPGLDTYEMEECEGCGS